MTDAKRRITGFNFDRVMKSGNKAHVALVDQAANEQEVLVMKAKNQGDEKDILKQKVNVTMDMSNFLMRFFGMWDEDALALMEIMGIEREESEDDAYYDEEFVNRYISNRIGEVSVLKGKELPETLERGTVALIKSLQTLCGDKLKTPSVEEGEDDVIKTSTEGESKMDEKEILEMKQQLADLQKEKEAAKVLKQELEDLRKAQKEQKETEMRDLVKGFTFVAQEEVEDVAKALLASDSAKTLITVMEKARKAIAEAVVKEEGSDDEGEVLTTVEKANDYVTRMIAERKKENV